MFENRKVGESDSGFGVYDLSNSRDGVVDFGPHGSGVRGQSNDGHGVIGTSDSGFGVHGVSIGVAGVVGEGVGDIGAGVYGISHTGHADMIAISQGTFDGRGGAGMVAVSREKGGIGIVTVGTPDGIGMLAVSENNHGVSAGSTKGDGVNGFSQNSNGVFGKSNKSTSVKGESLSGLGVYGTAGVAVCSCLGLQLGSIMADQKQELLRMLKSKATKGYNFSLQEDENKVVASLTNSAVRKPIDLNM